MSTSYNMPHSIAVNFKDIYMNKPVFYFEQSGFTLPFNHVTY